MDNYYSLMQGSEAERMATKLEDPDCFRTKLDQKKKDASITQRRAALPTGDYGILEGEYFSVLPKWPWV